eukprot:TRINITY_DN97287_c0_g1_i1.p1 TRINITY_DN97287_c0_g1~~TRINITY_DN97287_c0_g1_i1.p1  ORF type:complete len:253 (-),score=36.65 TRINITY_DN97287_c0_g1_i1:21-743(-)
MDETPSSSDELLSAVPGRPTWRWRWELGAVLLGLVALARWWSSAGWLHSSITPWRASAVMEELEMPSTPCLDMCTHMYDSSVCLSNCSSEEQNCTSRCQASKCSETQMTDCQECKMQCSGSSSECSMRCSRMALELPACQIGCHNACTNACFETYDIGSCRGNCHATKVSCWKYCFTQQNLQEDLDKSLSIAANKTVHHKATFPECSAGCVHDNAACQANCTMTVSPNLIACKAKCSRER